MHAGGANAQSAKTNLQKRQFLPKVPFELAKSTSLIHYTPHTSKYALYDSGREYIFKHQILMFTLNSNLSELPK